MDREWFKKGFFEGRLLWLRGGERSRALGLARELMSACNTDPRHVWVIDARDFMSLDFELSGTLAHSRYEVILLEGFEDLSGEEAEEFLFNIRRFQRARDVLAMRLILRSDSFLARDLAGIHELSPLVFDLDLSCRGAEDAPAKALSILDQATVLARVPIHRITERVAHYLEDSVQRGEGEEVLLLVIEGLRRSNGKVLRFRDILPNFNLQFGVEDSNENPT